MTIGIVLTGAWSSALKKLAKIEKTAKASIDMAVLRSAHEMRAEMIGRIDGQVGFAPHAPATPFLRSSKGSKILIAEGAMRSAITVVPTVGGAFVGVHRSAPNKRVRIAEIQEGGAKIRVTPRMRRYLHARLRRAGAPPPPSGHTAVEIVIPPRPFVGPVVARWRDEGLLQARVREALRKALGL